MSSGTRSNAEMARSSSSAALASALVGVWSFHVGVVSAPVSRMPRVRRSIGSSAPGAAAYVVPSSKSRRSRKPRAVLRWATSSSDGTTVVRSWPSSELIGLRTSTASRSGSSAGRPSLSSWSVLPKLHPTTSSSPRPTRRSCSARSARWRAVSRPAGRPAGSVAGTFARPSSREISSMRSIGRVRSLRRRGGIVTVRMPVPDDSTPRSIARSSSIWRASGTSYPRNRLQSDVGSCSTGEAIVRVPRSIIPPTGEAPASSAMSWRARRCASRVCSTGSDFSKRPDASVRTAMAHEALWIDGPCQVATSIATRVVVASTSERSPPMMPATDVGPSASEISRCRQGRRARRRRAS